MTFVKKLTGVAVETNNFGAGSVLQGQPQYFAENSVWKIRVIGCRQFAIFINGVQATGLISTTTDIVRAGFGYMPGTVTSISLYGFVRTRRATESGKQNVGITIHGDSMSALIHGGWDRMMRKALEGAAGLIIDSVTNYAVPGYTSAQVYAEMQAKGFVGGVTLICAGTNDIQSGVALATTIQNIRNMITYAGANGQICIVWIPPLWYTQAEAGAGRGQASGGASSGSNYRVNIKRLCASLSIKCVDMTQYGGPIDAAYLLGTRGNGVDYRVRDNIHPTGFLYRLIGVQMARAVLGELCNRVTRESDPQALPATYSNGWSSHATNPAKFRRGNDGDVKLSGYLQPGTLTDGLTVMTLAEDLCPTEPMEFPCNTSNGMCRVTVGVNGVCVINGVPASSAWINLSTIVLPSQN